MAGLYEDLKDNLGAWPVASFSYKGAVIKKAYYGAGRYKEFYFKVRPPHKSKERIADTWLQFTLARWSHEGRLNPQGFLKIDQNPAAKRTPEGLAKLFPKMSKVAAKNLWEILEG